MTVRWWSEPKSRLVLEQCDYGRRLMHGYARSCLWKSVTLSAKNRSPPRQEGREVIRAVICSLICHCVDRLSIDLTRGPTESTCVRQKRDSSPGNWGNDSDDAGGGHTCNHGFRLVRLPYCAASMTINAHTPDHEIDRLNLPIGLFSRPNQCSSMRCARNQACFESW